MSFLSERLSNEELAEWKRRREKIRKEEIERAEKQQEDKEDRNPEREVREEQEEFKKSIRNPLRGTCLPEWATKNRLLVLAGVVFANTAAGFEMFQAIMKRAEDDTGTEARAGAAEEGREFKYPPVKRLEGAFKTSARFIRESESLKKNLTPEQREIVISGIENFPVKEVLAVLSEMTGDSASGLANSNKTEIIIAYSGDDIDSAEVGSGKGFNGLSNDERERVISDAKLRAALTVSRRAILVNVEEILSSSASNEDFERKLFEVLLHEFLHGFPHQESFVRKDGERDDQRAAFYEGMTEMLSNDVRFAIFNDLRDSFQGYQMGEMATAELVVSSLGIRRDYGYARMFVSGSFDSFDNAFQKKFGVPLDEILDYDQDKKYYSYADYHSIAPVIGMIELLGDAAEPAIADANAFIYSGAIGYHRTGDCTGVLLVNDSMPTGIANGVLRFEQGGETHIVTISSEQHESRQKTLEVAGSGDYKLYSDLHLHNPEEYSLDFLNDDDRDSMVREFIEESRRLREEKIKSEET